MGTDEGQGQRQKVVRRLAPAPSITVAAVTGPSPSTISHPALVSGCRGVSGSPSSVWFGHVWGDHLRPILSLQHRTEASRASLRVATARPSAGPAPNRRHVTIHP